MSFDPLDLLDAGLSVASGFLAQGSATLTPPNAAILGSSDLVLAADVDAGAEVVDLVNADGKGSGAVVPRGSTVEIDGELYKVTGAAHRFGKLRVGISPGALSGFLAGEAVTIRETAALADVPAVHMSAESAPANLSDKGVRFGIQLQRQGLQVLPSAGWGVKFVDPRGEVWSGSVLAVDSTESIVLAWIGE